MGRLQALSSSDRVDVGVNGTEKFRFDTRQTVGAPDALHDSLLAECFVDNGAIQLLRNLEDHRRILLGRTGTGKTALLQQVKAKESYAILLSPDALSLGFLANSDIVKVASALGVNLALFYRLLWRHVLLVEVIQRLEHARSERSWTDSFLDRLTGDSKRWKKLFDYMMHFGPSFWESSDERAKEVVKSLSGEIGAQAGLDIGALSAKISSGEAIREEERRSYATKIQQVVSSQRVSQLGDMLGWLNEYLKDPQKPFFILIDGLDEDWIDEPQKFDLIRSLVDTARDFSAVKHCKILIALRDDLFESTVRHTNWNQREKVEGLIFRLRWNRAQIEEFLDRRTASLVRRYYGGSVAKFADLFAQRKMRSSKDDPVRFVLNRIAMRPRDALVFFQHIVVESDGKSAIQERSLLQAELGYSLSRLDALSDEWSGVWPDIGLLLASYPTPGNRTAWHALEDRWCASVVALLDRLGIEPEAIGDQSALAGIVLYAIEGRGSWADACATAVQVLFEVGFAGVSVEGGAPVYCYDAQGLRVGAKVQYSVSVHRAFQRGIANGWHPR